MKIKYLLTATLLAASLHGHANTHDESRINTNIPAIMIINNFDYAAAWQQVEQLDKVNQPRAALKLVQKIKDAAVAERNYQQAARAFIYIIDYDSAIDEADQWHKDITEMANVADNADADAQAFFYLLIAKYYTAYHNAKYHMMRERTAVENDKSDDITTWSIDRFKREISSFYHKAVADPAATQKVPTEKWKTLIITIEPEMKYTNSIFCKTLFDVIAWQIIRRDNGRLGDTDDDFSYRNIELVSDAETFVNYKSTNSDTWSMDNLVLTIFQQLLTAHKKDNTPAAYAITDVLRLNYYHSKIVNEAGSETYTKSLKDILSRYPNDSEIVPVAAYHLGCEYQSRGELVKAHDITADAFHKFPAAASGFSNACNALAHNIEIKTLQIRGEQIVPSDKPFPIMVEYSNINTLYLHIYTVKDLEAYNNNNYDRTDYIKKHLAPSTRDMDVKLINNKDYKKHNSEIIIDGLPKGHYVIVGSNDKDYIPGQSDIIGCMDVHVSDIAVVSKNEKYSHIKFYVMDRTTGKPIQSAQIQVHTHKSRWEKVWEATTDAQGAADLDLNDININDWENKVIVTLENGDVTEFSDYFHDNSQKTYNKNEQAVLLTDRKIYRPGQTLYYKLISYTTDGTEAKVMPNKKTNIELRDVNYKIVAQQTVTTNEFGSAHGEFKLPVGRANGRFFLLTDDPSTIQAFRIEEYKRPTFEVTIEKPEGEVKINETITLHGSAATYAGTKISNGKVKYEVTRMPEWRGWWHWRFDTRAKSIAVGETTTDDDGAYTFSFTALPELNSNDNEYLVYRYNVKVDVTDTNGETRTCSIFTYAGNRSMFLETTLPQDFTLFDKAELDQSIISCSSINGNPVTADVEVNVIRLANFDKPRLAKKWKSCDDPLPSVTRQVWNSKLPEIEYSSADNSIDSLAIERTVKTLKVHCEEGIGKMDLSFLKKEGSGHYLVQLQSKDSQGRTVKYEHRLTLYNPDESITKVNRPIFIDIDKHSYEPGETATITMGSAMKELIIHYQVQLENQTLENGTKNLSQSVDRITVPIKENMRGGLSVQLFYIKNNKFENQTIRIEVPYTNKQLNATFQTFRDKLYPGDTEKWKIKITDYQQKPVRAEFAATLVDAAINTLAYNSWYLNAFGSNNNGESYIGHNFKDSWASYIPSKQNSINNQTAELYTPRINWFGHDPGFFGQLTVIGYGMTKKANTLLTGSVVQIQDDKRIATPAATANNMGIMTETETFENAEIRTNFAETAFFQPDIVTDYNGDLFVEFTVPQSITRWKMLGIAHTKDLAVGTLYNELVTNKDISIIPNMPRFMRCGDKVEIPVKFSNLGDSAVIRGQVKMEILDIETMRPIKSFKIWEPLQAFEIYKGKTEASKFIIEVPQYEKPVIIRIVGVSGDHSDGEQHIVPILTDKTLLTETMTLPVQANETRTFEFKNWTDNQSSTAKDHSLTLEYSSNPAWYAVTSLPWLSSNPYDCMEQTFAKLFANTVSKFIIDNNPDIKTILQKWTEDNSQALTSPLLKNQELKSLLIEETPWAIDGDTETDRSHNLNELLDPNRIEEENEKLIKKLTDGMLSDGSFPWFSGMKTNPWITQHIVAGLGKLRHIGAPIDQKPRVESMINRAIQFLDKEIKKYYEENIQKHKTDPGYFCIQYLYMRSFFLDHSLSTSKKAYDYILKYAKNHWTEYSLYYQAILCTVFKRTGDTSEAEKIIASLKDRAAHSDELGMYFNENQNGILWHENNIETQALIIEAFQEMGLKDEVEKLKIWLIKNRQSNRWSTTKATTEACYAMFMCGNKITANEPLCRIIVGGQTIDTKNAEAGTGYIKHTWQGHEMNKNMAKITVANPNPHTSYGAIYRQYFENLDNVKAADNKLQIEKKMFLNIKDKDGNDILREITPEVEIHPGDHVTARFIIRTDRDLDYVHLKDMRAAGFEPLNVISRTHYQDGMIYYESTKDASENFFFEHFNKGTYIFEYQLVAVHAGDFSNGIATIQCMYAPEFTSHSDGTRIKIVK